MRAGIFDSGIGGLSVLKSLIEARSFSEMIYYGDTARVPYGTKDKETIIKYSLEALDFFHPFNLDCLIIACNTVSAYALNPLRKRAKFPVIGVIEAGVLALENKISHKDSPILVIATQATIHSQSYQLALQQSGYQHITSLATPLFVPFVEEEILEGDFLEQCLKHYFKDLCIVPKSIILGCTHYPFIAKPIDAYFKHQSTLIHSGEAIVEYLEKIQISENSQKTKVQFYSSEDSLKFRIKAEKLLSLL